MYSLATLAALIPMVAAHGSIKSPPARQAGSAYAAACGEQPFNQQSADKNGNVQGILQVVGDDFNAASCKLWQCKGFQFDDNKDNVQQFSPGQTIDFDVEIAAPHTGYANVSVVKTGTDTIIGQPLIEFDNYASNAGMDANNTAFSVTLPTDFGGECTTEGDCVLQWYWDAPDINQTYESCVDFVVSGSGGGNSPAPSSSAAPASTTAAATSVSQPTQTAVDEEDPVDDEPADDDCEDEEPTDDDEDVEPVDDEDGEDCDEEPVDDEPADDEDDCGEGDLAEDEPADGADDDNEQNNGSDEYPEQTPTSAPGPIIVPITDETPAPTQTGGSGNGNGNGSGNGNGNGNNQSMPTTVSTVTVTAAPSTVTVTAQPTVCL